MMLNLIAFDVQKLIEPTTVERVMPFLYGVDHFHELFLYTASA